MKYTQEVWDVLVRAIKTALAVYASFLTAGGFNILHVSIGVQNKIAGLAFIATAILNTGLKVHTVVTGSNSTSPAQAGQLPTPPPQINQQ